MTERIRWRQRHDSVAGQLEQAKQSLTDAVARVAELEIDVRARDALIDELRRQVERAKLEGARGLADFMLGVQQ